MQIKKYGERNIFRGKLSRMAKLRKILWICTQFYLLQNALSTRGTRFGKKSNTGSFAIFTLDLHDRDVCKKTLPTAVVFLFRNKCLSHLCVQRKISSDRRFHIWKVDCSRPKSLLVDTRRIRMIERGYRKKTYTLIGERKSSILSPNTVIPFL